MDILSAFLFAMEEAYVRLALQMLAEIPDERFWIRANGEAY